MIKEAYVSFKVAKLLKEKGFSGTSSKYYCYPYDSLDECDNRFTHNNDYCNTAVEFEKGMDESDFSFFDVYNDMENLGKEIYIAPTQQMAMRWLREEKGFVISIQFDDGSLFGKLGYYFMIKSCLNSEMKTINSIRQEFYNTYEDAVESALEYSLINLI